MKKDEIKKLVEKGESEKLELKKSLSDINKIVETVSAFSNTSGGIILMGVSKEEKILGLQIGKDTVEKLTNKIVDNTEPKVYPKISIHDMEEKKIISVEAEEAKEKPVLAFGRSFKRVGKSSKKVSREEYEKIILEKHREELRFDKQICKGASLKDIDEEKVRWFLKKAKEERRLSIDPKISIKEALEKLDLIVDNKLKNAAIIMFGKEPQHFFLQSEVRCARFKGIDVTEKFLDMKVIRGNAYEQIDEAEKFVLANIRREAWTVPEKVEREERWEYPPDAIREAITNAIAHRDYFSSANVHVSIFDDRIEIWNPGKLPEPLTIDDLKKEHKSVPVNERVANCLFLVKYIERWGTGTNKIINLCLEQGLPEPIFEEEAGGFNVVLRKEITEEFLREKGMNEKQINAVRYAKQKGSITNKEYQEINKVSKPTATRELKDLIIKKVFIKYGKTGKGTYYSLAERAHKGLIKGS